MLRPRASHSAETRLMFGKVPSPAQGQEFKVALEMPFLSRAIPGKARRRRPGCCVPVGRAHSGAWEANVL